ncbi:MAG: UDP-N-acetylmuramyl pentapeptide phosphotransferase, partial [Nitrospinota bacterium]
LEDIFNIPSKLRLLIQFVISTLIVWLISGFSGSMVEMAIFLFWIIFITGTANFYNFMDGINGIAGLTGIVAFGLVVYFSFYIADDNNIIILSIALMSACFGFLPFNFPKAKVFMGDVGSVFLGFVFGSFVVRLSNNISIFLCLIMFLCTFYADAIITIYYRWKNGENLMQAHRSHLYQYMSNELGLPHWKVSIGYAVVQLIFGFLAIGAYNKNIIWQTLTILIFGVLFITVYNKVKKISPKII